MRPDLKGIGMTSSRTRERLIERLRTEGIRDEDVLAAIRKVPRHLLVDEALSSRAYEDTALPIGFGQTISQPYIVARMTETLRAGRSLNKVLEIGTGSGYQTAVLSQVATKVYTVERLEPLLKNARRQLLGLGVRNAQFKLGDGSLGWPEHAPYDGIIVTAAAVAVPPALLEQLALDARLVIPVGSGLAQELLVLQRTQAGYARERLEAVSFVPLIEDRP
ncbi:MAG: protein-L-isoaspartate(D-aspartate) O-methyltransferase [Gammaproteobacteria bacterium]|nr:protein-L-isoaspartate(D-aspartate) O-methyltransferase [Gammaproteobacteria bacterium]